MRFGSLFRWLLQVTTSLAIIALSGLFLRWVLGEIWAANPQTAAAIVTVLGGVSIAAITYLFERSKARAEAHREHKVEIYERFLNMLLGALFSSKLQGPGKRRTAFITEEAEWLTLVLELKRDMLLWSSPSVIRAFVNYLKIISSPDFQPSLVQQMRTISACLKAMRSDIGLSNNSLSEDFFAEWILQDPAEIEKFRAMAKDPSAAQHILSQE
jgi:hypothetical protein